MIKIILIFTVFSALYCLAFLFGKRKRSQNFLKRCPDAAKVFVEGKIGLVTRQITVYSANGKTPYSFQEGLRSGFCLPAGENEIEVSFASSKSGVLHKTAQESTDVKKLIVETGPRKNYSLGYDEEEESFTFTEI